ncbi:unnamed protein product, partial [Staurois parvus]
GRRRTPRRSDRSRALRRSGGRRTPRRSDRSRALRRSGGRRTPRRSDRSSGLRRSGGRRTPRRSGGAPRTPGTTVGSESTGMTAGTGSDIGWLAWTAGNRVTRHQVIWLDSGHRVIWQGSGLESTGMTAGTGADIESLAGTAGIGSPGIRSFGSTAGTASSGKAEVSES